METAEQASDFALKGRLERSWPAFFARHGRLTDIQRKTVPLILDGRDCLITAPTASGKTEAAIAPIAERALEGRWPATSIIYVSPTRALVNDLFERLEAPLRYLGLTVARRTGDRPEWTPTTQSHVILTTPESLDSILARHPDQLKDVRAVIIDEIHLIDGTTRGDQVRGLLARLRLVCKERALQVCALSATVRDPERLSKLYLASDAAVSRIDGARPITWTSARLANHEMPAFAASLERAGLRKVLFFANTRAEAEETAQWLRKAELNAEVLVHHASLKREIRESAEQTMKAAPAAFCAATMTLELGIDIGDVDAVVLVGPPNDVNSLLQRVGRGNRRREDATLAYLIHRDPWEELVFETLVRLVDEGELTPPRDTPYASVLVQQALSYAFQKQRKGVSIGRYRALLHVIDPNADVEALVEHLCTSRLLTRGAAGLFFPGEKLWPLARMGNMHCTFDGGSEGTEVVDARTGRPVGHVGGAADIFTLAGRTWRVVERKGTRIFAKPIERGEGTASFGSKHGPRITPWIGARIRESLTRGNSKSLPVIEADGKSHLAHCLGRLHGEILADAYTQASGRIARDRDGKVLITKGPPTEAHLREALATLDEATRLRAIENAGRMNLGRYFYHLSDETRQAEATLHAESQELRELLTEGSPTIVVGDAGAKILERLD